jgi:ketosteroid isomerase-like protein
MTTQMTETEATLDLIHRFDGVGFNTHDVDAIMADMTEDAVFECFGPAEYRGRWEGQDAVRAVWEGLFAAVPDCHFETDDIFAAGNRCSYSWTMTWTNPDGSQGSAKGSDVYTVRDGKVAIKTSYIPPME